MVLLCIQYAGLPRSRKNIWKTKFFAGQGKVREFCGRPGKFRKDLESQGKVREIEKKGNGRQTPENLFILFKRGKGVHFHELVSDFYTHMRLAEHEI